MTLRLKAPALVPSVVMVAATTAASIALLALVPSDPANTLIADGLVLLAAVTATGLFAWAAREPRHRTAWAILAAAGLAFTIAETYWFVVEGVLQQDVPAVTFADALYLAGYAILLAAAAQSIPRRLKTPVKARFVLDFLIVFLSLSAIAWALFVRDTAVVVRGQAGAGVLLMSYPILDLAILGVLLFTIRASRPVHHARILLFILAALSWVLVDIVYARQAASTGFSSGFPVDAFWVGGYLSAGLAAVVRPRATPLTKSRPVDQYRWANAIYIPIIAFISVVAYVYIRDGHINGVQLTLGLLLLSTLVARQNLFSRELVATSRELADEKALLEETQATARLGTWTLDLRTKETWASKEVYRIFGLPDDGSPLTFEEGFRMVPDADRDEILDAYARILKEDGTYERDLELTLPDGRTKTMALHAHRAPDQPKDGALLEGTLQDITERKAVEAANRFQARLLDRVGDAVIATDAQGNITYWNASAESLYGWTRDEVLGRPITDVTPSETTQEQAEEILAELLQGQSWVGEFGVRRKDGSTFMARVRNDPIRDDDGHLVGVIGISQDITEQKRLETDLGERVKELRALSGLAQKGATATSPSEVLAAVVAFLEAAFLHHDLWIETRFGDAQATSKGPRPRGPELASTITVGRLKGHIAVRYQRPHEDQDIGPFLKEEQDLLDAMAEQVAAFIARLEATSDIEFQAHLLESVSQAVIATDIEGNITHWNPASERIFGWKASEVVDRPVTDILGEKYTLDRSVDDGARAAGDYRLHRKDGTGLIARMTTDPLIGTDGALHGFIAILQDVTEQRAAEERYREVVETSPAGICRTSMDGRIILANPEYARIIGYDSVSELMADVDTTRSLYADPSERGRILRIIEQNGRLTGHEFQILRRDGSTRWVRATMRLDTTEEGEQALTGFVEDIEETRSIHERFQRLVENSPLGIFRTTHDGTMEYVNPAGARLFGYEDPQQFIAELGPVKNMYADPEDREILLNELTKEPPMPLVLQFKRRDGTTFWGEARVSVQTESDGSPVIEGTLRDLTAERERHAVNARLAAIVTSSHEALYSNDLEGVIQTWNIGAEELYGYSADEVIGKNFQDLMVPPERRAEYQAFLDRIRLGRPVLRHDNVRRRKDGSLVEVSLTITPLALASGEVVGASVSAYDISERKAAEESEKALQENIRLQEVDRKLRDFINAAAHDLNQPLTPLKLSLFNLKRAAINLDDAAQRQIDMIARNVGRMELLVQDLLDVARLEAGTLKLNLESTRVRDLLHESQEFYKVFAEGDDITLDTRGEDLEVVADPRRITQVLFNMVGNAMKFTPEGGTITTSVRALEDKEQACIEVTDSGVGMTKEQMSQLFKPFSQVHHDTPNAPKGTGLGLYICKGIITQHEGKIGVRSDGPGTGSTFWFTLPLAGDEKREEEEKEEG